MFFKSLKNNWVILSISLFNFAVLFIPNFFPYYGYFGDELYEIACSKRLAFGYVDHPPFATFFLSIIRFFIGDSLFAIRLLPALAGGSLVFLIGVITKRLGGGIFAQGIACLAASIVPFYLMMHGFYSLNAFESLLLTCCVLVLIIIIQDNKPKLWLIWGLIIGIGIMNKHTFVVFGIAMLSGIMFTPWRKYFRNKYFWRGIFIACIVILPNVIWQIQNNFISTEYYKASVDAIVPTPSLILSIMPMIALGLNPLVFTICLLGMFYLFFSSEGKPYRVFGWMFLLSFLFFTLTNINRPDRAAPVYPILMAGGSIILERWLNEFHKDWLKTFIIFIFFIGGIFSFLISLPVLPPDVLQKYSDMIELHNRESETDKLMMSVINHHHSLFTNRLGWPSMVEDVAAVYHQLSKEDKEKAVILSSHCAEAGAIEFYGSQYNLPPVISVDNNYRLWGYGKATGDVMIAIGGNKDVLKSIFEKVEVSGIISPCTFCLHYQESTPIYVCRKINRPMTDFFVAHIRPY